MIRNIPQRHSDRLLQARWDNPGARYFITFGTHERQKILTHPGVTAALVVEFDRLRAEDAAFESTVMIMPDHVHWLFRQGRTHTLGQLVGRLKSLTAAALRNHAGIWQRNFFEHRLRPEDFSENFARYMFMNPYRAHLIRIDQTWPHWHRTHKLRYEFEEALSPQGTPPSTWLDDPWRPIPSP